MRKNENLGGGSKKPFLSFYNDNANLKEDSFRMTEGNLLFFEVRDSSLRNFFSARFQISRHSHFRTETGTLLLAPTLGGNLFYILKNKKRKKIGDGGGTGLKSKLHTF